MAPRRTTLQELFLYNDWANTQTLDAAQGLTDAQLDQPFEMGLKTMRLTLRHIHDAEAIWLARWKGASTKFPPETDRPSVDVIRRRMMETAAERDAYLAERGAAAERESISYSDTKGNAYRHALGDLMLHVANHGVHHRAQVRNMLRAFGAELPMVDYLRMRVSHPTFRVSPTARATIDEFGMGPVDEPVEPCDFDVETLATWLEYGDAMTRKILNAAASLSEADLDRPFEMGMGNLRKTLTHILDAEVWWQGNWSGTPDDGFQKLPETMPRNEIIGKLDMVGAERRRLMGGWDDQSVIEPIACYFRPGKRMEFLRGESAIQLGMHGTHHRAQAVNMLRRLGAPPPVVDYIVWVRDTTPGH
ncbi:MAG: DinB family protein [Phycisphaerales bacterium]|nr:DinB family protein [Phycisphaerales bacterium]